MVNNKERGWRLEEVEEVEPRGSSQLWGLAACWPVFLMLVQPACTLLSAEDLS